LRSDGIKRGHFSQVKFGPLLTTLGETNPFCLGYHDIGTKLPPLLNND